MVTPLSNSLIRFREFAIHRAFRISTTEVLNPLPFKGTLQMVKALKQTVNEFKQQAMDETGHHVNYQMLRQTSSYQDYTENLVPQLQQLNLSELNRRETSTAFWINLYNAIVIHAVIDYGIKESIAAGGLGDQVRFFQQAAYNVSGLRFSLEDIEHGILRANRGNPFQFSPQISPTDPRIHFALNCASKSCPPIGVYDHQILDQQLDLAAANYIQYETKLTPAGLSISKLIGWYKKDFGTDQDIAAFILDYLPNDERKAWLHSKLNTPNFKYMPYNWGLNM